MKLGLFFQETGHHIAAWRYGTGAADVGLDFRDIRAFAQLAESAKLDFIFLADSFAVRGLGNVEAVSQTSRAVALEPLTLLAALAASTDSIGLIATATTTYSEPYTIARQFASIDHISRGRAGWNVVTSNNELEAYNYGKTDHLEHDERYERATEFVDVVKELWDSWDDDAFVKDRASGQYFDPEKMHVAEHRGTHFRVRGPLNVARPPQGHPVIVQAGASAVGRDFAARTAEVIFTAQQTLSQAQAFYADMKARARSYGRSPEDLKIMPGFSPIIGRSEAEARERFEALQKLIQPAVGLATLTQTLGGADLSGYPLDGPLPELPATNGPRSRQQLLIEQAHREQLSIRDLYLRVSAARGHHVLYGTPGQIADVLEEWFTSGAADGFNVMPPYLPGAFDDFVALVVPELQRRGLFRSEYAGTTLRDHLGLTRPPSPGTAGERHADAVAL